MTCELNNSINLNKDVSYLFSINIYYNHKINDNKIYSKEIKTNKIILSSNNIDLNHEILSFENINYKKKYLNFIILLSNNKKRKKSKMTKITLSKLNLNKRQRIILSFPFKSKLTFNYIITENKEELDYYMKKAKDKRNKSNLNQYIFQLFENDDEDDEKDISHEEEYEEESKDDKYNEINNKNNEINSNEDLNDVKKSKTNSSLQLFNIFDDSKLEYSKTKTLSTENITILKPKKVTDDININLNIEEFNGDKYETFCQGFFITSFPRKEGKVIENSRVYRSICGHLICDKLPAMEPEIIYKYPLQDNKDLELNNFCSSICFPTGIKVCYNQDRRSTYKSFSTHIVNQKGKKYYLNLYHFYYQMDTVTYNQLYSEHPLKNYLRKFGDNIYHSKEEKIQLEKDLEECQELGFRENVYIPYAIVLISKYPYINQMKTALNNIFIILTNHKNILQKNEELNNNIYESIINDLIIYLIKIIPIPKCNTNILFNLPFSKNKIEILSPDKNNIRNLLDIKLSYLLKYFNVEDIITIYRLILFEQKLLFIDHNYNRIYTVIESFIYLLYPMEWINTIIPIMSHQMTRYLQTFLPFINGISEDLFLKNAIDALNESEDIVYEIYITKGKIKCRKSIFENINNIDDIPKIPDFIYAKLYSELNDLKEIYNNLNDNDKIQYNEYINNIFSNIFLEVNAIILYDFMDFIFNINQSENKLDSEMLREMIDKKNKKQDLLFYNEIIDTQIFFYFLSNIIQNKNEYSLFISMLENINEKYVISSESDKPTKWKNIIRKIKLKDIIKNKKSKLKYSFSHFLQENNILYFLH